MIYGITANMMFNKTIHLFIPQTFEYNIYSWIPLHFSPFNTSDSPYESTQIKALAICYSLPIYWMLLWGKWLVILALLAAHHWS